MGSSSSSHAELQTPPPTPPLPPSKPIPRLPPPMFGKLITMLSIDGGGIRGLIPAVVLSRLEEKLQGIDGDHARIADYFDVIAGTSTGALIAVGLTTPDKNKRPKCTAKQIKEFYLHNMPTIFSRRDWLPGKAGDLIRRGPKYDGMFLGGMIKEFTGGHTLADTLTKIVVPTFDVHRMQPVIFSSYDAHQTKKVGKPCLLWDVCLATSAAPTYFAPHYIESISPLIDGGVVANNPTIVAITKVTREQLTKNPDFHPDGVDYKKYLVISIGTGSFVEENGVRNMADCANWSGLMWLYKLVDIYSRASASMADLQLAMLLGSGQHGKNYLRIQALETVLPMDIVTPENMTDLIAIGEELLKQKVASVDLISGKYETDKKGPTNDEELERFAKLLSAERKLRLENELHYIDITKAFTSSPPPLPSSSEAATSISPASHSQMPAIEEVEGTIVESQERETAVALKNVEYGFLNLVSC